MGEDLSDQAVRNHLALANLAYRYFAAIDLTLDVDELLACIATDGELDYRDLGVAAFRGHDAIRGFFGAVFGGAEWQVHYLTNFHVTELSEDGTRASASAYLFAKACRTGAPAFDTYGACQFRFERENGEWKIKYLREYPLAPITGAGIPSDLTNSGAA